MNNLTTRKIVLGLLMALVLAFSVQGIAEAQSVSVSGDGSTTSSSSGTTVITDYRISPDVERSFTIRVSSAKNGETVTIDPTGASITEVEVTSAPSPQTAFDTDADSATDDEDAPGGSDEQITPAKGVRPGSPQTITFNGLGKPDSDTATGSWTIKVSYEVTAFGRYSIEIGGSVDTDVAGSPITAYVVRSDTLSRNASIAAGSTTTPVLGTGSVSFTVAPATPWTRVDLKVTGGKLYLDSGQYLTGTKLFDVTQRKEFTSLSMFTNSSGVVTAQLIQDSGRVAKITATIPGANEPGKTYTVTSFASAITVEQVSGNHQFGYTNQETNYGSWTKLQNALSVRVVDGHETNKGVEGQWVRFTTTGGRLRAVSRALLWPGSDGSVTSQDDNQTPLTVKTDGSGYAKVYLLPGTTAATYTVTYAVISQTSPTALGSALTGAAESSPSAGAVNEQFTATAIQDTATTRDYVIDKSALASASTSTPVILRSQGDTELKVKVLDRPGGSAAANVQVDFSVSGGRLTLNPGSSYQTSLSTVTGAASPNEGIARVWVQASGNSVAIVTARIAGNNEDAGRYVVTFLRSGPYIEYVSGDDQDGAVGGRLENPLVVKVLDGQGGSPIPDQIVRFQVTPDDANNDHSTNLRQFLPVPGTYVFVTEASEDIFDETAAAIPAADSVPRLANALRPARSDTGNGQNIFIQTGSDGEAKVYLRLGSADNTRTTDSVEPTTAGFIHRVTAKTPSGAPSSGVRFRADAVDDARQAKLEIVSGDGQSADKGDPLEDPLVVRVRTVRGFLIQGILLKFTALDGTLLKDPDHDTALVSASGGGNQIRVRTGSDGEARVDYNVGQLKIAREVSVEVVEEPSDFEYEFAIDEVRFGVNGGQGTGSTTPPPADDGGDGTPDPGFTPLTLTVSPTSITGRPGSTQTISVTASETAQVGNIVFGEFLNADGSASPSSSSGTFTSTLTLPAEEGQYDLVVSMGSIRRTVSVTVSSTAAGSSTGGTVSVSSITPGSGAPGTVSTVTVSATDEDGDPVANVSITLSITAGGGTFSQSPVTTNANGLATSTLTRGSTLSSNYFIKASASGYTFSGPAAGERVTITGTESPGDGSTPRDAGEADSIYVYDGNNQRGTPNSRLAEPLVIEVVDSNNRPVSRERVTFRTTRGSGQFSPERPRTNATGRAQTRFTPTSSGDIRITATVTGVALRAVFNVTAGAAPASVTKVSGDNQSGSPGSALANPFVVEVKDEDGEVVEGIRVTFSVTAGGGSLSETSAIADEDGLAETTLTLGSQVGINSVQASVSGVDSVTFSTSVDAKIIVAAANRPVMYWIADGALYRLAGAKEAKIAEGANGVAIGGGKIYWTSQTSASAGAINSANLDGTDKKTLTSILAVPMGIAVDTAGSKLYWTNTRGRIQSANLNGSGIQNVLLDLSAPTDIVVSNGFIYWTEGGNSVRRVNISGQKVVIDVAVNLNTVGGLAVGSGKVYWTEMTSATAGTVNGANLNGTNFETLATLLSAPMGISVDTAGSKLYWTNARGRVQSANLDGSMIKNVVEGLISPSKIAIGGANMETVATIKATTPAKKDNAKYDVNGDGKVDNTDASLVAAGFDTGNAKYDVNGDGMVNFFDLLLVFDNRDDDAAAAPAIVGMKLNAVQIDRIEEQIDLLIATNDRSPAAMRTLVYMQQLLATARPEKTQLFANYPNPFNPETWIPYELATDTHVRITIYNTQGVVIRTLQFGHQSAGYYTDRDRAAYWDGRNALGEQVASGLYFYQLETDEMSSMRKMVILK